MDTEEETSIVYFRKAAEHNFTIKAIFQHLKKKKINSWLHLRPNYWYLISLSEAETSTTPGLEAKFNFGQTIFLFVQNSASLPIMFSLPELRKKPLNKISKWQSIIMQAELSLIWLLTVFNHFRSVFNTNVLNTFCATAWKYKDKFYETICRKLLDGKNCLS